MPVVRNHAELDRFKQDKIISLFNKVDFLTQQFENAKVTQEENAHISSIQQSISNKNKILNNEIEKLQIQEILSNPVQSVLL